jgi:hypothetical protein
MHLLAPDGLSTHKIEKQDALIVPLFTLAALSTYAAAMNLSGL